MLILDRISPNSLKEGTLALGSPTSREASLSRSSPGPHTYRTFSAYRTLRCLNNAACSLHPVRGLGPHIALRGAVCRGRGVPRKALLGLIDLSLHLHQADMTIAVDLLSTKGLHSTSIVNRPTSQPLFYCMSVHKLRLTTVWKFTFDLQEYTWGKAIIWDNAVFFEYATQLQVYRDVWSQNGGMWALFGPLRRGEVYTKWVCFYRDKHQYG